MSLPQTSDIRSAIALIIMGVFVFVPTHADALTISPARIELAGDPGQTIDGKFLLINDQPEAHTFYTSAQNFDAQGETGTPNFTSSTTGLASWVEVQPSVTLAKGEQVTVPFRVRVPTDADPGGQFAAIFLSTVPPTAEGGSVSVGAKIGTLLLLRVSGAVEEGGGIIDFSTKDKAFFHTALPVTLSYRFSNDGGDRVNPTGDVVVRNIFGIRSAVLPANPGAGNVLPGSIRRFDVQWGSDGDRPKGFFKNVAYEWHHFAFGIYGVRVSVAYATNSNDTKVAYLAVFPWQLLIVIFVALAIIGWILVRGVRRYNRWIIKQARGR